MYTRESIIQQLSILGSLKEAQARQVGELQEAETKAQNDLILARQIQSLLDIFEEMLYTQLTIATETEPQQ